jgi:hypothetical protein
MKLAALLTTFTLLCGTEALKWGSFKRKGCSASVYGHREYSSVLWDIPWGHDWVRTCEETSAEINGFTIHRPYRCVNTGLNVWGEFNVPDDSCKPHWGELKHEGCFNGKRRFSAILWDVPSGYSWEDAAERTEITIKGKHFPQPSFYETGMHLWGYFELEDDSC